MDGRYVVRHSRLHEYTKLPLELINEQLAAQGLLVVSTDERVIIEKMRIDITEKSRDIGQLCRRIEQIAKRRTS